MPEHMPGRVPEDMPDRMPDRMPEDMSDRMPEDLPVIKRISVMVGITRSKVILFNVSVVLLDFSMGLLNFSRVLLDGALYPWTPYNSLCSQKELRLA